MNLNRSIVQSFKSVRLSAPGMLAYEKRRPGFASATERSTKRKVEETMQHTHNALTQKLLSLMRLKPRFMISFGQKARVLRSQNEA